MHIDFLDIGTCDFDIGNGVIDNNKTYLLVEPVWHYLNNLPTAANIIKANFAISDKEDYIQIYFVKEKNIEKYNLPYWVRGCNKINTKHPTILKLIEQCGITDNIFTQNTIRCITFQTLIQIYGVTSIQNLKIDTEGHDHIVFKTVADSVLNNKINIENIKLEYLPVFANTNKIDEIRFQLKNIYPNQKILGEDLYLSKI
jgi:hypothetical protein